MKVNVWFHRAAKQDDSEAVLALMKEVTESFAENSGWQTRFTSDEGIQVSVSPLGSGGEYQQPEISVTDIEAVPILIPRAEIKHLEDGMKVRMKSILSVRSDLARNRIGNLRSNVRTAIRQLRLINSGAAPGIIALRIRPPRDLGDLYHTDREIRALLTREAADHVAIVAILWNEGDRHEESVEVAEGPGKAITAAYRLKPYFIGNPPMRAPVQMGFVLTVLRVIEDTGDSRPK